MEENTQTVVNELNSHGGRIIRSQDIEKRENEISELLLVPLTSLKNMNDAKGLWRNKYHC